MKRALAVLAGGIALLLLTGGADAASVDNGDPDATAEVLGRVLVVETGGDASTEESAGIVHVALNRAKGWGASVSDVVYSRVPSRPEWGSGCAGGVCDYNTRLDSAAEHPAFHRIEGRVLLVLDGTYPNPIGSRRNFLHPGHSTFRGSRARGTSAQQAQARALRQRAAQLAATDRARAADAYRQANQVEDVDPKYAYEPQLGLYLPTWSVDPDHGGRANHRPITIGRTRFS